MAPLGYKSGHRLREALDAFVMPFVSHPIPVCGGFPDQSSNHFPAHLVRL